jgi:hypothetical protein
VGREGGQGKGEKGTKRERKERKGKERKEKGEKGKKRERKERKGRERKINKGTKGITFKALLLVWLFVISFFTLITHGDLDASAHDVTNIVAKTKIGVMRIRLNLTTICTDEKFALKVFPTQKGFASFPSSVHKTGTLSKPLAAIIPRVRTLLLLMRLNRCNRSNLNRCNLIILLR